MERQSSTLFVLSLKLLALLRRPYLFCRKKFPDFFKNIEAETHQIDSSRMLTRFNFWGRLFFKKLLSSVRVDEKNLDLIFEASKKGPIIYLMRNWGQTEYNYYNRLFLKKGLPLAIHNNLIKMSHWMPWREALALWSQKLHYFFEEKKWPYNDTVFDLKKSLKENKVALYCLNLPREIEWNSTGEYDDFEEIVEATKTSGFDVQIVPLHFVYDRHPEKEQKTLMDILFGERHDPGLLRKIIFFFRNYRKRAVARIGESISLKDWLEHNRERSLTEQGEALANDLHQVFYKETKTIIGPKLKSRRMVIEEVLGDSNFQEDMKKIAGDLRCPVEEIHKRAQNQIKEIAGDINSTVFEIWEVILNWVFKNIYDGLIIDKEGLDRVRQSVKEYPLILVPAHRSHMDYILLSYAFLRNNISVPYICAGINLSFFPLGSWFRRSGAFFIRRSFGDDKLYPLSLKYYIKALLKNGNIMEFFIEGTRSRSGKLFPPKTGMVSMIQDAYLEGACQDVHFMPVSISYERIMEEKSYLAEVKGGDKAPEKKSDILKIGKFLKKKYGKVYLQFGEAKSLKDVQETFFPEAKTDDEASRNLCQNMSEKMIRGIGKITTLLPSSLIASSLLSSRKSSFTLNEILDQAETLFGLLRYDEIRYAETLKHNHRKALMEALNKFVHETFIQEHQDGFEKFFTLDNFNRRRLDFFKNNSIHFFAGLGILIKSIQISQEKTLENSQIHFTKIQELFKNEFWLEDFGTLFAKAEKLGILTMSNDRIVLHKEDTCKLLTGSMRNFYESYWMTLKSISKMHFSRMDGKELLAKILERGELALLRGHIFKQESLGQFTLKNALQFYLASGLILNHEKDMGKKGRNIYSSIDHAEEKAKEELALLEACLGIQALKESHLTMVSSAS